MNRLDLPRKSCQIIGHRGARAFAPENTLPAFQKAADLGCSMVELDVHLSKDGELIVHHDDDLIRCTDAVQKFPYRESYYVSDFTVEQLQSLDAGTWYVRQTASPSVTRQPFLQSLSDEEIREFVANDLDLYGSGNVRIPTLSDVLSLAKARDLLVNIEIKSIPRMYPEIARKVVVLVNDFGMTNRVVVSSFDHEQLLEVRRHSAALATGVLTSDRLANIGGYLRSLDADSYHPGCYGDFDSLGFGSVSGRLQANGIQAAMSEDKLVFVWTCNQIDRMHALIKAGITGIMTDFPNRLRAAIAAYSDPQ